MYHINDTEWLRSLKLTGLTKTIEEKTMHPCYCFLRMQSHPHEFKDRTSSFDHFQEHFCANLKIGTKCNLAVCCITKEHFASVSKKIVPLEYLEPDTRSILHD